MGQDKTIKVQGELERQFFETSNGLKIALTNLGLYSPECIEKKVGHEKAHYNEAVKRGCKAKYQLMVDRYKGIILSVIPSIIISESEWAQLNCEDRAAIILAPENPSWGDYKALETLLKQELEDSLEK